MALHTFSIPSLRGSRARLRAPSADDAARLFALFSDAATMRWWPRAPMRTLAEATGYLEECADFFARGDRIDWIVVDVGDMAIGTCTLYAIDRRLRRAEIGYAVQPDARGRGIATDAVAQVIAWSVRNLDLRRFEACVARDNVSSQRVLERLGFAEVGTEPSGVVRWALDATATGHSRRSAASRNGLPSA